MSDYKHEFRQSPIPGIYKYPVADANRPELAVRICSPLTFIKKVIDGDTAFAEFKLEDNRIIRLSLDKLRTPTVLDTALLKAGVEVMKQLDTYLHVYGLVYDGRVPHDRY